MAGSHTSAGATPLSALDPHERRFSLHPLQTFTRARGPEQLDGAWAAVTAETDEARALGFELARTLGLDRSSSPTPTVPLYHAGAAVASNYLVTLHEAAAALVAAAGAPPEALEPLMRRTIENGFELTGPIERGDWETVEAHREAIRERAPRPRAALRRARRGDGAMKIVRTAAELAHARARSASCRRWAPSTRATSRSSMLRARENDTRRRQPVRQPGAVRARARTWTRYPRDEERDAALAEEAGVDVLFVPAPRRSTRRASRPGSTSSELGSILEGEHRPGHFRGVATVCLKLFNLVRPRPRLLRPEGRAAGRRRSGGWCATSPCRSRSASSRPCATRTASRFVPQRLPVARGARARRWRSRAPGPRATAAAERP